jgi:hypothetical protein
MTLGPRPHPPTWWVFVYLSATAIQKGRINKNRPRGSVELKHPEPTIWIYFVTISRKVDNCRKEQEPQKETNKVTKTETISFRHNHLQERTITSLVFSNIPVNQKAARLGCFFCFSKLLLLPLLLQFLLLLQLALRQARRSRAHGNLFLMGSSVQ